MFTLFAAIPIWVVDLGTTDGAFVSGGETNQWAWGTPTSGPTTYGTLWGTNLDGPYLHDTTDWLQIALPDLSGLDLPALSIEHWYAIRDGDTALLQIDAGAGFITAHPAAGYPDPLGFVGTSGGMVEDVWNLSGWGSAPIVRLLLAADASSADDGWFVRRVIVWDGDLIVPTITPIELPTDTQDLDGPNLIEVEVTDDRAVASVELWVDDGTGPVVIPMTQSSPSRYSATFPAAALGATMSYWVEASDGDNIGRYPMLGEQTFRTFLAAPTGLEAILPDDRPVATEAVLIWDAPETPHAVSGYEVRREGTLFPVAVVQASPAIVSLGGSAPLRFTVSAIYDDLGGINGDPSETLALDIEVPTITLDPPVAYQGEELYLTIEGQSLYLLQSTASIELGPDVDLLDLTVRDINAAVARVRIHEDAATGPTDLVIASSAGLFSFSDIFTIRSGDDAPRIERIEPAEIKQGETRLVEIEATVPFASIPTIGTDDDLVITTIPTIDEQIVRFELAAASRARIGPHTLSFDDGERLYTVDIEVDEVVAHVKGGCAQLPLTLSARRDAFVWLAAPLLVAGLTRRRPASERTARRAPRAPAARGR